MLITEGAESGRRTTEIQRALGLRFNHQHLFLRAENLCGLSHETHPRYDHRACGMGKTKASHLQRVSHAAPGLFSEFLQLTVNIVMRDKYCVFACQKFSRLPAKRLALCGGQGVVSDGSRLSRLIGNRDRIALAQLGHAHGNVNRVLVPRLIL